MQQKNIILIIDSCNVTRQAYNGILSHQYVLRFAETAQKGLREISNNVRLIFLDMVLSDASGFETLSAIKQDHPSIPVVMTTSDGSEEKCLAAFRSGARDYIKKPLRRGEILQKTEEVMNITPLPQGRGHIPPFIDNDPNLNNQNIPQRIIEGIGRVTDYIVTDNYTSPFDLDDACKLALLNRSYFCYYFKIITGYTFKSYASRIKMQKAMELIGNRGFSITETAQILGYSDLGSFSRSFKRLTAMTPKQSKSTNVH